MPNTKTGTTWAPDIRPEKIETFEETYTPEGGEQQIIEYRAVNHHPILNKVLDKMAFFRTHVGAIWYNLAERKTLLTKLNELDAELREVNAKMRGIVLWTNPNLTAPFAPQDIVLSSSDYDKYKIRWKSANTVSDFFTTNEINKGDGTFLSLITTGGAGAGAANRRIAYKSDTVLSVKVASFAWGSTAASNNNAWCIPIEVIGFKS